MARWLIQFAGTLAGALVVTWAAAEHMPGMHWMRGYHGQSNASCCGVWDCAETTVIYLGEQAGEAWVMVGETEYSVPEAWVHPSQTGRSYWCFIPQPAGNPTTVGGVTYSMEVYEDAHGVRRAVPPAIPTRENTRCLFYRSQG
jgi:hypothetical protein